MADATIEYLLRIRDEASQALKDLGEEAGNAEDALKGADEGTQNITASMIKAQAAIAVAVGGFKAIAATFSEVAVGSIEAGAQMQGFHTRLTVLTGSAEAAQARLDELFRIGSTTPFELPGLIEAEVNLRALGVNAEETLPLVMDFAGAMGVDLASAAVEVGRAMQFGAGAVETISGRALRAQVELRTGQDTLKMSTEEFRTELVKTLTDPDGIFAGGTAKLAATFNGMVSNMRDAWFKFQKDVADTGLFSAAQDTLVLILELLEDNKDVTEVWSGVVGTGLTASLLVVGEVLALIGQGALALFSVFQEMVVQAVKVSEAMNSVLPEFMAVGRALPTGDAAEEALQLTLDSGAALAVLAEGLAEIRANLGRGSGGLLGAGGGGGDGGGGGVGTGTVVVEGTAAPVEVEDPNAADALKQVINNTAGLMEGTIPGNTWWAAAINLLAKIGDEGLDMDWSKLGDTIHDAFVGVVKLHLSHDQLYAVIVDAIFFGVKDALTLWWSETLGSDGRDDIAQPESFKLFNKWFDENVPSFQTGTKFVDQTGIALLHKGERVVPANGATPSNMQGFGGGGGLVVNVNAPLGIGPGTAEQLVRELNSILGARGLNLAVT